MRPGWSQGWRAHPPHEGRRVAVGLRRRDGVRSVLCHVTGPKGVMPTLGSNALGTLHKGRLAIGTEVRLSAAAIPGAEVASGQGVAVLVAIAGRVGCRRCSSGVRPGLHHHADRPGHALGIGQVWDGVRPSAGLVRIGNPPGQDAAVCSSGRGLRAPRRLTRCCYCRGPSQGRLANIHYEDTGLYAPADRRRKLGSGGRQVANGAPALPRLTQHQA